MRLADVAQLVEQLICNQQVVGSIPTVSSSMCSAVVRSRAVTGVSVRYSSGQRDQTVNLTANAFEGSNPSLTMVRSCWAACLLGGYHRSQFAGVAQLVER